MTANSQSAAVAHDRLLAECPRLRGLDAAAPTARRARVTLRTRAAPLPLIVDDASVSTDDDSAAAAVSMLRSERFAACLARRARAAFPTATGISLAELGDEGPAIAAAYRLRLLTHGRSGADHVVIDVVVARRGRVVHVLTISDSSRFAITKHDRRAAIAAVTDG